MNFFKSRSFHINPKALRRVNTRTWIGIGLLAVLLPIALWKLLFKPEVKAATMTLTTNSSTQVQIDVPNRYRIVMNKGDTDDYILVYDRAQSDSSPNNTYELLGPVLQEASVLYEMRWDGNRVTSIIESTDTRIKVRVTGCLDTTGGGACLKDNSNAASDDILLVSEDYTFTPDGMFVTNSTNFQDNGVALDNSAAEDGYNWFMMDADVTDAAFSGTINYGNGESETSTSADASAVANSNRYFMFTGGTGYQSAIVTVPRTGWFDLSGGTQNWNYDAANSGNLDRLHARERGSTPTYTHAATWSLRFFAQDKLDTEAEREQMINTYTNPDVPTYSTGSEWNDSAYPSSGLNFDGSNDYVTATGNNDTRFTFSAWVKTRDTTLRGIMGMGELPGSSIHDRDLFLNTNSKFVIRTFTSGGAKTAISTTTAVENKWYHVAATYDGTNLKIYVNGVNEATTAAGDPFTSYTTPEYVVGQTYTAMDAETVAGFFDGQIDEVRIYDTSLTQAQIQAAMYNQISPSTANLKNYYRYNEGTGSTAFDETTNNYDGSFGASTAAPTWTSGYVADQFNDSEGAYTLTASENQANYDIDAGSNVSTLLNGAVSAGATTITVDSTTGFASSGVAFIDSDRFTYAGVTATTFTGVASTGEDAVVGHADNTVVASMNRLNPSYKVGGYRDTRAPSLVTQEGTTLRKNQDYNISQKPVTSSTWGQDILWYSSLDSATAVTSSDVGDSATINGTVTYTPGKFGNGVLFNANSEAIDIPISNNFNKSKGAIEFWVKPNWDSSDNTQHNFVPSSTAAFQIGKAGSGASNVIYFDYDQGGGGLATLSISTANFSIKRGNWYHFRAEWDDLAPLDTQMRLFINGTEPAHTDSAIDISAASLSPGTSIGLGEFAARNCDCVMDEFYIYGGASPVTLATGGQAGNTSEFLSRSDNNQTLSFALLDGSNRGEYVYLGSDTQVGGYNIDLATVGTSAGTPNLDWEYWNGTSWSNLESVTGFTDGTSNLTQSGSMYWTATPPGWSPYSINASADLYYIRASLNSGATAYTVSPVESQILTDVVTLQTFTTINASDTSIQITGGPIPSMHWKFDEGNGTTANDSSGFGNSGTISGATWQNQDLCISGKCLYFDGSNDKVSRSDDPDLDATDDFTISGWFRHKVSSSGTDVIAAKYETSGSDGGYKLLMESDGDITFGIDNDNSSFPSDSVTSTAATYDDDKWHHVAAVKDGTSSIKLYIDGILIGTDSSITSSTIANNDTFYVGIDGDGSSNPFEGFLDEMRVFQYARSQNEIYTTMVREGALRGSSAVLGVSNTAFLYNGLMGYWKMDETSGNTTDYSGNANTLTNNGTTTFVGGKFGNGSEHVPASSQYFSTATTLPGIQTISFWVNPDSTTNNYINLSGSIYVTSSSGTISATGFTSPTIYVNGVVSQTLIADTWQLVTITDTTPISGTTFEVGRANSNYMDGTLDEVRLYSRVLTGREVLSLYNFAPGPIGYWPLDENTGTSSVSDISGNAQSGTMNGTMTIDDWVPGKFGSALDFDATDDFISVADNATLSPTSAITVAGWVNQTALSTNKTLFTKWSYQSQGSWAVQTDNSNSDRLRVFIPTNIGDDGTSEFCSTPASSWTTGWHHVAFTFNGAGSANADKLKIYIDGNSQTIACTGTLPSDINDSTSQFRIGAWQGALTRYFNGKIDDVKIYNYPRTSAQIVEDMNGGHPVGGSPVGSEAIYYKLDEQQGTTANNSGTSTQAGTRSNATWATNTTCKINGCLSFDGTGDVVTIATASDSDVDFNGSDQFSGSAWVYPTSVQASSTEKRAIIAKYDATTPTRGYRLYLENDDTDSTGNFEIEIYDESTDQVITAAGLTDGVSANTWYHVAFSFNGGVAGAANDLKLYVNGRPFSNSANASFLGLEDVTADFTIGEYDATDAVAADTGFIGYIDDVKIYAALLTEDQVKVDMNANSSVNFATATTEDNTVSPSLIEWKMDENTGTTLNDTTGSGNTGTATNGPLWVPATYGSGLQFDGTNDLVTSSYNTDSLPTAVSISLWFKTGTTIPQEVLVDGYTGADGQRWDIQIDRNGDDKLEFVYHAATAQNVSSLSALSTNTWYHVVFTHDGSTNKLFLNGVLQESVSAAGALTSNRTIGLGRRQESSTLEFNGIMDQFRVYNVALTQAQVAYDYNRGKPVGWWKFDECSGTTINDASGNGVTGTISSGDTSGSNDSTGNCNSGDTTDMWNNGTSGKVNSALDFDGTNDCVTTSVGAWNFTQDKLSVSAWVKLDTTLITNDYAIVRRQSNIWNLIYVGSTGKFRFEVNTGGVATNIASSRTFIAGIWYHVTGVYDGTNMYLYVNGILENSASKTGTISSDTTNRTVVGANISTGGGATCDQDFFDGKIDDLRIYNYNLTASQIKKIMNDDAAARFAPVSGQP